MVDLLLKKQVDYYPIHEEVGWYLDQHGVNSWPMPPKLGIVGRMGYVTACGHVLDYVIETEQRGQRAWG